jgi:hypothetical protein
MQEGFGIYSYANSKLEGRVNQEDQDVDESQRELQPKIEDLERGGKSDAVEADLEDDNDQKPACSRFLNTFKFLCCCFGTLCSSKAKNDTATYIGEFRCGQKDGKGLFKDEEGNSAEGTWKNNEWVKWEPTGCMTSCCGKKGGDE